MRPYLFQLCGVGTERSAGSDHIVPNADYLVFKEVRIHLNIILFLQALCSLFLLDLCAMNCGTFANNLDMGKAVDCSRKLADKFRKVLIACLVTLLTACRNAREDNAANLTTKLFDKHLCHALRHICMVSNILEIIDNRRSKKASIPMFLIRTG